MCNRNKRRYDTRGCTTIGRAREWMTQSKGWDVENWSDMHDSKNGGKGNETFMESWQDPPRDPLKALSAATKRKTKELRNDKIMVKYGIEEGEEDFLQSLGKEGGLRGGGRRKKTRGGKKGRNHNGEAQITYKRAIF